jgi:glycosyltransferase involved in cell wall biosynthesis
MRILWAARWEYDKDPDTFFRALDLLGQREVDFRLSVIGPKFRDVPPIFAWAAERFVDRIDRWGYQRSGADYGSALIEADVVVSTAAHEFFGLSVAEAAAAGAFPVLPRRLAYPEVFSDAAGRTAEAIFHDGTADGLAARLAELAAFCRQGRLQEMAAGLAEQIARRFSWKHVAGILDNALADVPRVGG